MDYEVILGACAPMGACMPATFFVSTAASCRKWYAGVREPSRERQERILIAGTERERLLVQAGIEEGPSEAGLRAAERVLGLAPGAPWGRIKSPSQPWFADRRSCRRAG